MLKVCVLWVAVCGGVWGLSGCGTNTAERVAWYEVRLAQARSVAESIDEGLDPALEQLAVLRAQLDAIEARHPGSALASELRLAVERAARVVEAAKQRRAEAFRVVEEAEAALETLRHPGVGWGDELVAAGRLGRGVAPMTGSAAPWVYLGSTILAAVGGLFVRRPGDIAVKDAKQREDAAWDAADEQAFERGLRMGRAEGALAGLRRE